MTQQKHQPLPRVRLQPTPMNPTERKDLVHFMGMMRATQFSIGTVETKMTGTVKGAINRCYTTLQTTLNMLLGPGAWNTVTDTDLKNAESRKKKAEVLGAAIYEVSLAFRESGYRPEALMLLHGFNSGDVITPDGLPMRELDVLAQAPTGPEPEEILNAEQHLSLAGEVDYVEALTAAYTDQQKGAFYLQLAERCAVIARHYANL